jgi:hypothetical protein
MTVNRHFSGSAGPVNGDANFLAKMIKKIVRRLL